MLLHYFIAMAVRHQYYDELFVFNCKFKVLNDPIDILQGKYFFGLLL